VPERRALFGVPGDRPQERVDVHERPLGDAVQYLGPFGQGEQVAPLDRLELTVDSRSSVPKVVGAYTPVNSRCIPPDRITSRSLMLSAPATRPAMTDVSFGVGLAAPDQLAGEPDVLVQQARQAGLLGQLQHRDQSRARHQIHVIERGDTAVPPMRQFSPKVPF
jgi:hypothetical protein